MTITTPPTWQLVIPTKADIPAIVDMCNAVSQALNNGDSWTAEEIEHDWSNPQFDHTRNTRLILNDAQEIIGYASLWDVRPPYVSCFMFICVHPDYETQGVGSALLDWAEARAQESVHKAPPEARVQLIADTIHHHTAAHERFQRYGFRLSRHFWRMEIELAGPYPTPELPDGIIIRPQRDGEARAIHDAMREAFRDHYGHVEVDLDESFRTWKEQRLTDPSYDPALYFVAMDGDEIAGFSLCEATFGMETDLAWLSTLGVRRPWRKQGIAKALLYHTFNHFHAMGKKRVGLGVDAANPTGATQLYESVGMYARYHWDDYEKELRAGVELRNMAEG